MKIHLTGVGGVAMGNLAGGMDARVGAPGGGDPRRGGVEPPQRRFHRLLHRRLAGLALPAREGGAVIFDLQGKAGHGPD